MYKKKTKPLVVSNPKFKYSQSDVFYIWNTRDKKKNNQSTLNHTINYRPTISHSPNAEFNYRVVLSFV